MLLVFFGGALRRSILLAMLVIAGVSLAGCAATPRPMPTPIPQPIATLLPGTLAPPPPGVPIRPVPTMTPVPSRPTPAPAGWKPAFTGGPRLRVSAESEDAGTLVFEEQVLAGFLLINEGDAPLVMTIPPVPRLVEGC
mgnify:CR=1 FL=1